MMGGQRRQFQKGSRVECTESIFVVAVAKGKFGKREEGESPPFETGTRGMVKGQQTGDSVRV
jgi:hypothetical protein